MKQLYLAGGSWHDLQEVFSRVKGVVQTAAGYIQSAGSSEKQGVMVVYDPKVTDIGGLLTVFFQITDPYVKAGRQAEPVGIYYLHGEDVPQIEYYVRFMQTRGGEPEAALGNLIVNDSVTPGHDRGVFKAEYGRLESFREAEAGQQHYLRSHPEEAELDFQALAEAGIIK